MAVKKYKENGKISIESPYNYSFIEEAKALGGIWNPEEKVWEFVEEAEKELSEILKIIYNFEEKDDCDFVQIRIPAWYFAEGNEIRLGGYLVALRRSRDEEVKLFGDWKEVSGSFAASGGSIRNPQIIKGEADEEIEIEGGLPVSVYKKLSEEEKEYTVLVDKEASLKEALESEKEELLAKLAEIEESLKRGKQK